MFTYSHANTSLGQSERAYYLSYFINKITDTFQRSTNETFIMVLDIDFNLEVYGVIVFSDV